MQEVVFLLNNCRNNKSSGSCLFLWSLFLSSAASKCSTEGSRSPHSSSRACDALNLTIVSGTGGNVNEHNTRPLWKSWINWGCGRWFRALKTGCLCVRSLQTNKHTSISSGAIGPSEWRSNGATSNAITMEKNVIPEKFERGRLGFQRGPRWA